MPDNDPLITSDTSSESHIIRPPDVYVRKVNDDIGFGVFAARKFLEREVVETAKVLIIEEKKKKLPDELYTYVFDWGNPPYTEVPSSALALGYGSLYNHANPANLRVKSNPSACTLIFVAARDIAIDEELTINYNSKGGGPSWFQDLWFRSHGLKIFDKSKG